MEKIKIDYLNDSLDFCLYANEIVQKFQNRDIIVYGTNFECYNFLQVFANYLRIKCLINHWETEDLEQMRADDLNTLRFIRKNEPVFILSRNYWIEIVSQLQNSGFILGRDLFFWEQSWSIDNNVIQAFIQHNNKLWHNEKLLGGGIQIKY